VPIARRHHDFEELKLLGERRKMTSFSPWYDEFDLPRKVLLGCTSTRAKDTLSQYIVSPSAALPSQTESES
jgi:hypothetical protein